MRILGRQFVMGRTIDEALTRGRGGPAQGYTHSFDMLGEAARTAADAERYFQPTTMPSACSAQSAAGASTLDNPGISVKLSALHPRYEYAQRARVMNELVPRLLALAEHACRANIGFTIDAEEADRLEISLDVLEQVCATPSLDGWQGLGLAVQAYQKRGLAVVDWLAELASVTNAVCACGWSRARTGTPRSSWRKKAGWTVIPVFTRKASTDVSYLACARAC